MRRRLLVLCLLVLIVVGVADLRQSPEHQISTRGALAAIRVYQGTLSRLYARMGVQCRFSPTCSHYSESCLREFGFARGGWLSLKRVLRCGPWTPAGTSDPAPTTTRAPVAVRVSHLGI